MATKTSRDTLSIDAVIRHRWQLATDDGFGNKKYSCKLCGCEKDTSVSFINQKPFYQTTYNRSGIHHDKAPDCWGAKNPV